MEQCKTCKFYTVVNNQAICTLFNVRLSGQQVQCSGRVKKENNNDKT